MSRPKKTNYDRIIELVSQGISTAKACKEIGISTSGFYKELDHNPKLVELYTRAREDRGDCCLDKIENYQKKLEAGQLDSGTARVLIETEKWKACKFYPKMYGEKQEVQLSGGLGPLALISNKELLEIMEHRRK